MALQLVVDSAFTTSSRSSPAEDSSMVTLHVDGHTFAVKKALLIHESPVFNAMFGHDTKEAASNHVDVLDFDASTVAAIVACLNGHMPTTTNAEEVIEMLWFADKYFMEALTVELEAVLIQLLTADTLFAITRYASTQLRQGMMAACVSCYWRADNLVFGPDDYDVKQALIRGIYATRL
uniref:BTB domain-containing protein n=1 Tax=Panagrellus redivivus TaxID=6233 RepID=A0A7E4VDD3_PANRE